jgi:hypothetical protein
VRRVRDERPLRRLSRPGLWNDGQSDGGRSALHPHAGKIRGISPSDRAAPRKPSSTARPSPTTLEWDDAAEARMKKIPAFVRGMVVRAVEDSCRRNGISRVTPRNSSASARGCRPRNSSDS